MSFATPGPVALDRRASLAAAVATGALVAMPLAMWLANRSAPLLLAFSALACLARLWLEGRHAAEGRAAFAALRSRAGMAALTFLAFALVSAGWSHRPAASLAMWFEFAIPLASGFVVARIWPAIAPRWASPALLASLALAALLTLAELFWGTALREAVGLRAVNFIFNRTAIALFILCLPLAGWFVARRDWGRALVAAVPAAATVFVSESEAAKLAILVVLAAAVAAWLAPRLTMALAALGVVALVALGPVQGEVFDRLMPARVFEETRGSHSRDRVDIWLSFGEAIKRRPFLGAGFGASGTFAENPVAAEVPPHRRLLLASGHGHSAEVQLWAETGAVGAALALWALLALVAAIGRRPPGARVLPLAALAGTATIAAVGHGAWQGWWVAILAAMVVWIRAFDRMQAGVSEGVQQK